MAVIGPLLVGLGFDPVTAVLIPSVGHSWAVTFGSLGSSFYALMAATGRSGAELAPPAAAMLGLAGLLCGVGVLWATGRLEALRRNVVPLLLIGLTMGGAQYLVVTHGLWSIGGMSGGLAGMGVGVAWARWRQRRTARPRGGSEWRWALLPYGLLVAIVLAAELFPPLHTFLGRVVLRVPVPELTTARGWVTAAGTARSINLFGHAGALLLYASLLTFGLYARQGRYTPGAPRRIVREVVRRGIPSGVGIATMVAMAVTMDHAGMTHLLADGLSRLAGPAFPLVSPFIGALGAFMTGSNTNSNVVFGLLQEQVATLVGMSPLLALAAQTAGGAIGGMFAPAKVIVGCAPAAADEGATLRRTMAYGLAILSVLAVVTLVVSQVG